MARRLLLPLLFTLILVPVGCKSAGTPAYLQGMLGANAVSNDEITRDRRPEEVESGTDLDTTPMIMGVGQVPLVGTKDVNVGIEIGGSISWWLSGLDIYGYSLGGGGAVVAFDVENQFWMAELFAGPYLSILIADRVRIYGGAGAGFTFGYLDYETEQRTVEGLTITEDESDSDFSAGIYGRAGIEYQFAEDMYFGFCARYLVTDFTFGGIDAKVDLELWQALASFTVGF
jgi:hypothetical protein